MYPRSGIGTSRSARLRKMLSWFIAHHFRAGVTRFPTNTTTAADWSAAPLGSKPRRIGVPSPARSPAEPARPSGRQTSRRTRRTRPTYVGNGLGGFGQRALLCSQTVLPRRCPCVTQYSFACSFVRSRPASARPGSGRPRASASLGRQTGRQVRAGRPSRLVFHLGAHVRYVLILLPRESAMTVLVADLARPRASTTAIRLKRRLGESTRARHGQ